MQYRPDAVELLDAVAELLEREVIDNVPPHLQHRIRVSANVCRILQREAKLGPDLAAAERTRLLTVLASDASDDRDLPALRGALAARLDDPAPLSPAEDRAIFDALLATVRDDLAIAKPGYDKLGGAA
ncbi:MAG TPA: DUF6285 domain-containing protein [Acidimicrobiales bacterium]